MPEAWEDAPKGSGRQGVLGLLLLAIEALGVVQDLLATPLGPVLLSQEQHQLRILALGPRVALVELDGLLKSLPGVLALPLGPQHVALQLVDLAALGLSRLQVIHCALRCSVALLLREQPDAELQAVQAFPLGLLLEVVGDVVGHGYLPPESARARAQALTSTTSASAQRPSRS